MTPIRVECPSCQQTMEIVPSDPGRQLRRRAVFLEWFSGASLLAGCVLIAWHYWEVSRDWEDWPYQALPALGILCGVDVLLYFLAQFIHIRAALQN